jgi:hypothetical protein
MVPLSQVSGCVVSWDLRRLSLLKFLRGASHDSPADICLCNTYQNHK